MLLTKVDDDEPLSLSVGQIKVPLIRHWQLIDFAIFVGILPHLHHPLPGESLPAVNTFTRAGRCWAVSENQDCHFRHPVMNHDYYNFNVYCPSGLSKIKLC